MSSPGTAGNRCRSLLVLSLPLDQPPPHPANVSTRNGYAKNGSGLSIGVTTAPQKILSDTIANSAAATHPAARPHSAKPFGTLVIRHQQPRVQRLYSPPSYESPSFFASACFIAPCPSLAMNHGPGRSDQRRAR